MLLCIRSLLSVSPAVDALGDNWQFGLRARRSGTQYLQARGGRPAMLRRFCRESDQCVAPF
jgi:hypothetical protein